MEGSELASRRQPAAETTMHLITRVLPALLLSAILACAHSQQQPNTRAERSGPTLLKVENQGFADMNIYVLSEGRRVRLGMVTGNSSATFTIPPDLVGGAREMRFLADPIGGSSRPVSDNISVLPGDQVSLVIPPSAS